MSWRETICRIARVPEPPSPPPGEGRPVVFRAAPSYLRFRQLMWVVSQISAVIGLLFGLMFIRGVAQNDDIPVFLPRLLYGFEILAWITFVGQLPFSWAVVILDYELRWYIMTDRSLRIREGILRVKEKTMAFANIQNIAIRQGPLQRILSIADVEVRNAGGGGNASSDHQKKGTAEPMHVGYFRGVDNAEAIRDLLRAGVRRQRDAGLGDPDEPPSDQGEIDAVGAAREVLTELRAARVALEARIS